MIYSVRTCFRMLPLLTVKIIYCCCDNESTAGADASVEMPKLHNIKLLKVAMPD